MIQYAMYKGKGKIANALIRWWKRSIYSHCELVIDGVCYSSSVMDGGVRAKRIDLTDGKWDLIDLPDDLRCAALSYFGRTLGQKYSWGGILWAQFFSREYNEEKAAFCSEWCAAALGIPTPQVYSPDALGGLLSWLFRE